MKTAAKKRPLCVICIILMIFIFLAKMLGLPLFGKPPDDPFLTECVEKKQTIQITGTVTDRIEKSRSVQYLLSNSYLRSENTCISLNKIIMTSTTEDSLSAGSVILVSGTLSVPEAASNPGQFDLQSYYASQRIYYSLYADSCYILQHGKGIRESLLQLREGFAKMLNKMMKPENAEVMKAILLGDRTGLTADIKRDYQVGGILHILAISGMHISMLGQGLLKMLERMRLPFPVAAAISFSFLAGYCLMTGAAPSAVRAVCMFAVLLGARLLLRTYDPLCALAFAGILMLLENPAVLFASGFQLSFCAILAVAFVWPSISWLLPKQIRKPGKKSRSAGSGKTETVEWMKKTSRGWTRYFCRLFLRYSFFWLVITISMLPLTAWYYYEIPVWGLLPNLLLVPAAPVLIASGVAGVVAGCMIPNLGVLCLLPAGWLLDGLNFLMELIRQLPMSTLVCGKPEIWQMILTVIFYYLLLAAIHNGKRQWEKASDRQRKKEKKKFRKIAVAGTGICLFVLLFRWEPIWSLTMLDVGQGDCLVLRDRTGSFLVDGGSSSIKEVGNYRIVPYIKSQGITRLNGVFITHPDEDHINGVQELFCMIEEKKITLEVDVLYLPIWIKGTEEEKELITAAKKMDTEVTYLARGDKISSKTIEIYVLNPFYEGGIRGGNSGSLVLSLSCGSFDALLTGDMEKDGEEQLLPIEHTYDYLKAAHHGSKGSSSEIFLQQVQPQIVTVSAPVNSKYGHPHQETIDRINEIGSRIFVTRDCGAVIVEGGRKKWKLYGYVQTVDASEF